MRHFITFTCGEAGYSDRKVTVRASAITDVRDAEPGERYAYVCTPSRSIFVAHSRNEVIEMIAACQQ